MDQMKIKLINILRVYQYLQQCICAYILIISINEKDVRQQRKNRSNNKKDENIQPEEEDCNETIFYDDSTSQSIYQQLQKKDEDKKSTDYKRITRSRGKSANDSFNQISLSQQQANLPQISSPIKVRAVTKNEQKKIQCEKKEEENEVEGDDSDYVEESNTQAQVAQKRKKILKLLPAENNLMNQQIDPNNLIEHKNFKLTKGVSKYGNKKGRKKANEKDHFLPLDDKDLMEELYSFLLKYEYTQGDPLYPNKMIQNFSLLKQEALSDQIQSFYPKTENEKDILINPAGQIEKLQFEENSYANQSIQRNVNQFPIDNRSINEELNSCNYLNFVKNESETNYPNFIYDFNFPKNALPYQNQVTPIRKKRFYQDYSNQNEQLNEINQFSNNFFDCQNYYNSFENNSQKNFYFNSKMEESSHNLNFINYNRMDYGDLNPNSNQNNQNDYLLDTNDENNNSLLHPQLDLQHFGNIKNQSQKNVTSILKQSHYLYTNASSQIENNNTSLPSTSLYKDLPLYSNNYENTEPEQKLNDKDAELIFTPNLKRLQQLERGLQKLKQLQPIITTQIKQSRSYKLAEDIKIIYIMSQKYNTINGYSSKYWRLVVSLNLIQRPHESLRDRYKRFIKYLNRDNIIDIITWIRNHDSIEGYLNFIRFKNNFKRFSHISVQDPFASKKQLFSGHSKVRKNKTKSTESSSDRETDQSIIEKKEEIQEGLAQENFTNIYQNDSLVYQNSMNSQNMLNEQQNQSLINQRQNIQLNDYFIYDESQTPKRLNQNEKEVNDTCQYCQIQQQKDDQQQLQIDQHQQIQSFRTKYIDDNLIQTKMHNNEACSNYSYSIQNQFSIKFEPKIEADDSNNLLNQPNQSKNNESENTDEEILNKKQKCSYDKTLNQSCIIDQKGDMHIIYSHSDSDEDLFEEPYLKTKQQLKQKEMQKQLQQQSQICKTEEQNSLNITPLYNQILPNDILNNSININQIPILKKEEDQQLLVEFKQFNQFTQSTNKMNLTPQIQKNVLKDVEAPNNSKSMNSDDDFLSRYDFSNEGYDSNSFQQQYAQFTKNQPNNCLSRDNYQIELEGQKPQTN